MIMGEIAKGMGVTLKNFFKKPITVQYPKQQRNMHPRFRGAVGFVRDEHTGKERCVGCGLCSAVCPANCLTVVPGVDENGIRNAKIYLYDMSRCVFCGMCVEVCPELALVMTHEFELSVADRSSLVMDAEAMLLLSDREKERTGQEIEEPGFPAFDTANTGFLKHAELPEKARKGNFQSHMPLLGTHPHGIPMKWEDYLQKKEAGMPLAAGNLPPYLQQLQNENLPQDQQKQLPKAVEEFAEEQREKRTHLITTAEENPIYQHEIVTQDVYGRFTGAWMEGGKNAIPFKTGYLPAPRDKDKDIGVEDRKKLPAPEATNVKNEKAGRAKK